jgi:GTP-binding protein YchF
MSFRVGVLGYPKTGKTLLFNLLTGQTAEAGKFSTERHHHLASVAIPDPHLERVAGIAGSKKAVPLAVEVVDLAGSHGGEAMRKALELAELRGSDALLHVVRAFEDAEIPHVEDSLDAARDVRNVEAELLLADLATVESSLKRLNALLKKAKSPEQEKERRVLEKCHQVLEAETPLRAATLDRSEEEALRGYAFLSQKPVLHLVNVDESEAPRAEEAMDELREKLGAALGANAALAWASCQIEFEISQLGEEDARPFAEELKIREPCRPRVTGALAALLRLLVFYTANEKEARAWWLPRGATAVEAAAKVHSDFAKGFIRAETVSCASLFEAGSFAEARTRGLLHAEGRDYVVQDGDVIQFRFHVN